MNYYTDQYGRVIRTPDPTKNKYECTCKEGKVPAHMNGTPLDEIIWITCSLCGGTGRSNVNWKGLTGSGIAYEED